MNASPVLLRFNMDHSARQMYNAETSWLLAIVPFNIGPKYEFVSNLVQNSPKQEPHSRSNTI